MTEEKATPDALAAEAAETERKRVAARAEYGRLSLAAAEGDAAAQEVLPSLEQDLAALDAAFSRLAAAQAEAKAPEAAEVRAVEAARAAEQADETRALVAAQVENVARLDDAVAAMRAALIAMRDGNAALGGLLGSAAQQSIHDFNLKLPIM